VTQFPKWFIHTHALQQFWCNTSSRLFELADSEVCIQVAVIKMHVENVASNIHNSNSNSQQTNLNCCINAHCLCTSSVCALIHPFDA